VGVLGKSRHFVMVIQRSTSNVGLNQLCMDPYPNHRRHQDNYMSFEKSSAK